MTEIKTVAIVGLGALGTLFGNILSKGVAPGGLRIVADKGRIAKYEQEKLYSNGEACTFTYVDREAQTGPADLVLIAVKSLQLEDAIATIRHQVGEDTVILSLLNGITSEGVIAQAYGMEKVVPCVAYGMDAVKVQNRLTYQNAGKLCIGPLSGGPVPEKVRRVERFFRAAGVPHEVDVHMNKRMWGKFMLNVGVNQTVAVFGPDYAAIQQQGAQRETMIAAMREVIALSALEGAGLEEQDLHAWLAVLAGLNPQGQPSMRQDVEARRPSEVELFSGTVLRLAKKYGLPVPVNTMLYQRISAMETGFR